MRLLSLARHAAALLLMCGLGAGLASARACTLDQRPSVSANHQLAAIDKQAPRTAAQLATWSYFVFTRRYRAHQPIVLAENRRELARTLSARALRQPCGWQFGDGHVAYGWTVRHAYAHAGRWPIKVYVWDPQSGRWDLFDQVTITIS